MHGTVTFTEVFGKTFGCLCSRKCKINLSLADYRLTYKIRKCLHPLWKKNPVMCFASAFEMFLPPVTVRSAARPVNEARGVGEAGQVTAAKPRQAPLCAGHDRSST